MIDGLLRNHTPSQSPEALTAMGFNRKYRRGKNLMLRFPIGTYHAKLDAVLPEILEDI
jgi:hypothetical protein